MAERVRGRKGVAQRARRMQRTNGLCEDCLAQGYYRVATIVDHIVPLIQGGEDTDSNTRNLCDDHNEQRTSEQFGFKPKVRTGNDGWPAHWGAEVEKAEPGYVGHRRVLAKS